MTPKSEPQLVLVQPNPNAVLLPLRYYDPELQNAMNAEPFDKTRLQRAYEQAKRLTTEYLKQLADIEDRVNKQTFKLLSDEKQPLFDADLFELSMGDALEHLPLAKRRRLSSAVRARFGSFDGTRLHTLTYSRIAAIHVNASEERWFDRRSGSCFDSLLTHELTAINESLMQHAFLFVSGASISIRFERFQWAVTKTDRAGV